MTTRIYGFRKSVTKTIRAVRNRLEQITTETQ